MRFRREKLLELLNNKKLVANIGIDGYFHVFVKDTNEKVFTGEGKKLLSMLGIKFYIDDRI